MNEISRKKPAFPIHPSFRNYLEQYGRENDLPVNYHHLEDWELSVPLLDKIGNDTLWETVFFNPEKTKWLNAGLTSIYALLKTEGDVDVMEHLQVERIDYCTFGNSNPFRIRIINRLNDNYDYFYVKKADASRVYGLELEHLLSPNRMSYITDDNTLIEEHVAGIPGDSFMRDYMHQRPTNRVRLAKEFVKFNERCFVRLLGDMRAYNYVIDITPDFDDLQYRIRAIDFDQQSYEGRKNLYLPQFFKENKPIVDLCIELLTFESFQQYQKEERSAIARRFKAEKEKLEQLLLVMSKDEISTEEKVKSLASELGEYYQSSAFAQAKTMGDLLLLSLTQNQH
ncbi:MAG: hypothetical protein K1X82_00345 [Bacteroidia bacterium]|nr:hypothetical protein [Bacteroidia bacterium]